MKKNLSILFSIIILSATIGLGARFVFAQLVWEEPADTPPFDNELPPWVKQDNGDLYHTTGGNVGLGITSPASRLHIKDGQSWGSDLSIDAGGTTGGRRWLLVSTGGDASEKEGKFLIKDNNASAVRMAIDIGGNVGIGTTSPGSRLHIPNINLNSASSGLTLEGGWPWIYYKDNEVNQNPWVTYIDGNNYYIKEIAYADRNNADLSAVGNIRMTVETDGNVGIGTTSPGYKLDVQGGQINTSGGLCIAKDCKTAWSQVGGGITSESDPTVYEFAKVVLPKCLAAQKLTGNGTSLSCAADTDTNTTYSAGSGISISGTTISNTGDLSATNELQALQSVIDRGATANTTSNPMLLSYVSNNSAYNDNALRISYENNNSGSTKSALRIDNYSRGYTFFAGDTGNDSTPFIINDAGRVGIGTTSPAEKLHINGNVQADAFLYASDKNLKTDIQPLFSKDALEKILNLQGVSFKWKKDGTSSIGVIAQDLEKVVPELVSTDPNTNLKSVQYANLAALLIEAVKEQQQQIKRLEAEIEELKK